MRPSLLTLLPLLLLYSCGQEGTTAVASKSSGPASPAGPASAPAADSPSVPAARTTGGADMRFEATTIDFGEVWDTEDLVGRFAFENVGDQALVISEVKPSCGCTSTELTKMRYEPGEADAVELVWEPIGFGSQSKTITVRSNAKGPGIAVLTISARIKPFVTFEPSQLQFDLVHGQRNTERVLMRCVDPEFELLDLQTKPHFLTAEVLGRRPDGKQEIELVFDPATPWGQFNGNLQLKVRGKLEPDAEPLEHEAQVNVHASLFGDLRADPTLFIVGHVLPGRSFERRTKLTHARGEAFQVVQANVVGSKPPGMTVRTEAFEAGGERGHYLIVSGDAGDYEGLIRGKVELRTDIPGEGVHELAVMGIVRP